MKLTPVLRGPPVFHYWKDFGAGKKRRIPYYKQWWNVWRGEIARKKVLDCTIPLDKLPPGSRLMDAEDFMVGHIDALPSELIKFKEEKFVFDHPWPHNIIMDPIKDQPLQHCYTIGTRFFVPRDDALTLTNTILETDKMVAMPPLEPTDEHVEIVRRQYQWATRDDSVLVRLPAKRESPKINIKPIAKYGLSKERQEVNVLNSLMEFSQTLLAQHYHKQNDREKLNKILMQRSIAFPHCLVPFKREDASLNMDLCIDSMCINNSSLPQIDPNPVETTDKKPVDIYPRSWKSVVEKSRNYTPNWSFTMPRNSHLHTILLASRIKRDHRLTDEMLARSLVHAFGLSTQYVRLRQFEKQMDGRADESKTGSVIMDDPLSVAGLEDKQVLDRPIVLQAIGFDQPTGDFHFTRFQLNTINFDDTNERRIKNQAWYSGPINDLTEALRYYLDFQSFDQDKAAKLNERCKEEERARLAEEEEQRRLVEES